MAEYPIINPIRLHDYNVEIDYDTVLPNQDNMFLREDYQRGVYSVKKLYPQFVIGNTLYLQIIHATELSATIISVDSRYVRTYFATSIEVNGEYVNTFTIPLIKSTYNSITVNDRYYVLIKTYYGFDSKEPEESIAISDQFILVDWASKKDLVKINFNDSRNKQDGYFYKADGTVVWNPVVYYTGKITPTTPTIDKVSYTGDPGSVIDLQTTVQRVSILTLTDISNLYIDTISKQAACDTFIVNGVDYSASDLSVEEKQNTNLVDITMKLTQKDNSGFVNR